MGPGAGRRRDRPPAGQATAPPFIFLGGAAVPGRSRAPAPPRPPGAAARPGLPSYTGISRGPAGQHSPISPLSSRILASLVL